MEQIRVIRSFIEANALSELISADYEFKGAVSCKLFSKMLRSQDNDHYLVSTEDGRKFVARIYQHGARLERQRSDYEYELSWLNFLHENGVPVSYPIRRRDKGFLGSVNAPEGLRYYALFSMAKGSPMSVHRKEQLYICGKEMARIHKVSNEFSTDFERTPIDLAFLIDKPIERLQVYWEETHSENLDILLITAEEARAEIMKLIQNPEKTEDGWGPIGGDFHTSSTYFTADNKLTFFNFDLCGPGWRAFDIAVFLFNTNLFHRQGADDLSDAFFAGYYSERPLSDNEHKAIAPFINLRRIWQTAWFTLDDGLVGHTFIAPARPQP